jgi:hypothetical protein
MGCRKSLRPSAGRTVAVIQWVKGGRQLEREAVVVGLAVARDPGTAAWPGVAGAAGQTGCSPIAHMRQSARVALERGLRPQLNKSVQHLFKSGQSDRWPISTATTRQHPGR